MHASIAATPNAVLTQCKLAVTNALPSYASHQHNKMHDATLTFQANTSNRYIANSFVAPVFVGENNCLNISHKEGIKERWRRQIFFEMLT